MFTFIIVLLIIVSILLGAVVLVQNSKGGGLTSGLSASNQIMGVRKTSDALEKLTWGFAITLIVLAIVGNFAIPRNQVNTGSKSALENKLEGIAAPAAPKGPAQGQSAAQPAGQPAAGQPAAQPAQPAK
jgi:preprotein translocase subunit SecG